MIRLSCNTLVDPLIWIWRCISLFCTLLIFYNTFEYRDRLFENTCSTMKKSGIYPFSRSLGETRRKYLISGRSSRFSVGHAWILKEKNRDSVLVRFRTFRLNFETVFRMVFIRDKQRCEFRDIETTASVVAGIFQWTKVDPGLWITHRQNN